MSGNPRARIRGNSLVEFTLVGIPLIFILISTFEMARGMWLYHTLAHAVKAGTRYAVVHGQNCAVLPNSCSVSISKIATVIRANGGGLPGSTLTLTFTPPSGAATTCTLANCIANYTSGYWPPSGANSPQSKVKITGVYPFNSAIAMFWPGAGRTKSPGTINFSADSRENIQF
jgi:hypothetical protein